MKGISGGVNPGDGPTDAATRDEKHRLLELLLKTTQQGFWFIDTSAVTTDVNPAMCTLLGRSRAEIVGRSVFDFFAGADLHLLRSEVAARSQGRSGGYEIGISRPDGSRVYCFNNATPIGNSRGDWIGSVGIWTDITKRRNAEKALRTYELLANSITEMVSVVGEDMVYRMVNDAWCRATGRSREESIGRHASEVMASASKPERRQALLECIERQQPRVVRGTLDLTPLIGRTVETTYYPYVDLAADLRCVVMVTRDVTEQEHRRRQLAASEAELRALLDAFPGFITRLDENFVYTYANAKVGARLGVKPDQMIGRPIAEAVGAERAAWLRPLFERALRGESVTYERQHVHGGATTLTDQVNLAVGVDPRTGKRSIYTFGVDVTDRKLAEERLRITSEELARRTRAFEVTLGSIAQGIVSVAADGHIDFYNRRVLELLNLPESLLQAPATFDDVVRYQIARGDLAADASYSDAEGQRQFIQGGRANAPSVYVRRNRAGALIEVRTRKFPDGGLVRTFADVTQYYRAQQALRERESELLSLLNAFPGYIAAVDQDFKYTYVNDRYADILGKPAGDFVGRTLRSMVGDERFAEIEPILVQAQAGERVVVERAVNRAGNQQTLSLEVTHVAQPLQPGGRQICYAFALDISARKLAEVALVAARDEAERANRAKSQFISHMSHELRTPLNAVLGFGQLLATDRSHPLPDHQLRQVQEILRGGKHLLDLISDLLELGSIEAGQLQVELEAVSLADLVDGCMRLVAPLARSHGVQLLAPGADNLTFCALADRRRLKQVLLNLLGNAIKYNQPTGRAELECHAAQDEVYISVRDTGPGLSAEEQHRLFRPFERLGAAQSGIEGSGIGLALSRRLVEAMNGSIGVESAVGSGSTFWIRLPLAAPISIERTGTTSDAASQPGPTTSAANRVVLCIEDNPVNMLLMEAMLDSIAGTRMIGASTPEEGLQIAMLERPALILLDIQLPRLDGFEVLRRLRADESTSAIPVVAVSANAMRVDIDSGLAAGFDDYITKPVELKRLTSVVARLVHQKDPSSS